jgi:hypothetical protein
LSRPFPPESKTLAGESASGGRFNLLIPCSSLQRGYGLGFSDFLPLFVVHLLAEQESLLLYSSTALLTAEFCGDYSHQFCGHFAEGAQGGA